MEISVGYGKCLGFLVGLRVTLASRAVNYNLHVTVDGAHIVVATSPSVSTGPTTSPWLLGTPWEPETADPMEICHFHIRLRASAILQNLTPNPTP